MKYIPFIVLLFACTQIQDKKEYLSEGEKINSDEVITTNSFISAVSKEKQSYKVKGVVEEVCQMKGCWMTLKNDQELNIRVTFKDYGFFVPKDIHGREVILQGVAFKEVLEEDMAKHYAEDGGSEYSENDRYQVSFIAEGVLIEKS